MRRFHTDVAELSSLAQSDRSSVIDVVAVHLVLGGHGLSVVIDIAAITIIAARNREPNLARLETTTGA